MDLLPSPFGLLVLTGLFVWLEQRFPWRPARVFRPGWKVDALHLVFTHTLEAVTTLALVLLAWWPVHQLQSAELAARIGAWPRAVQVVVVLLLADLVGYWWHRAEHAVPALWRLHAVHHSSEQLDWLAGLRRHPLGGALSKLALFVPVTLLGFPPDVLGGGAVLLGLWAVMLHANVRFRFPRLRGWVATPDFHHWHHALELHGAGHNFAGLFPLWDRLFGTWHLPAGRPERYGADTPVPDGYLGQLRFPFAPNMTER